MDINFSSIILAVFALVLGILIPYVRKYVNIGKSRLEDLAAKYPIVYDTIIKIITSGVLDAELKYLQGEIEDKKEYALSVIKAELVRYGLEDFIDVDYLNEQIEIIVFKEFNKNRNVIKSNDCIKR